MTFTAPQERATAQHPQPDEEPGSSAHEIKYRQDAVNYVAAMLTELRQIAGKAGFDRLVTALDAAYYEAYGATRAQPAQAGNGERHEAPKKVSPAMEQTGQ